MRSTLKQVNSCLPLQWCHRTPDNWSYRHDSYPAEQLSCPPPAAAVCLSDLCQPSSLEPTGKNIWYNFDLFKIFRWKSLIWDVTQKDNLSIIKTLAHGIYNKIHYANLDYLQGVHKKSSVFLELLETWENFLDTLYVCTYWFYSTYVKQFCVTYVTIPIHIINIEEEF